jgi:hypothetical protein
VGRSRVLGKILDVLGDQKLSKRFLGFESFLQRKP